ncbi:MAG TPA: glycosyltransferase family 1 protein [Deltaproteobacteria bacterium]|jgi:glycosyltransferase involved in cell wall biosynthesis|nr:glycosyltransferase family 1 protein [Deltaproteobacteria bacterium]
MRIAHVANTDYFCAFLLRGQLRAARCEGHSVDVVCGSGPLLQELRDEGFAVHVVENSRLMDPVADLRTLRDYVGLFRRERYDVVHTHNPKVNALAALAARIAKVPRIVSTVHGLYSHERQRPTVRRVWRAFEAVSARLADLVLCQSAEDVRTARWRRIVPDGRLRRLGNGVDLARFCPERFDAEDRAALRRRLGVRPGEKVVGFVGRLVREKGVLELLSAVGARRGLKLWLIGPDERGSKRDALEPGALTAVENVSWLGLQREMPPLYAAMDVLALPSYREGFPRTLLEASAMERPVVATAIRGCREAVSSRETGLLVPPARPADLRSALDALLGDPARRRALGRAARLRARALFDERAVFDRIALAYRELALPEGAIPSPSA